MENIKQSAYNLIAMLDVVLVLIDWSDNIILMPPV